MKIQVSHGADPGDWFVVSPLPGEVKGHGITNEMAVQSLLDAGRTVCEVEAAPWQGCPSGREARKARKREQEQEAADG